MENFFRRYNWAIHLGMIAAGALLLALIANTILASQLAPFTVPDLAMPAVPDERPREVATQTSWAPVIIDRCFFGCPAPAAPDTCPEGCPEGEHCQNGTCVPTVDDVPMEVSDVPVPSDLNMKLLGCMVARDPQWSLALVLDNSNQQTHVARVGDMLGGEAEVVEIRRDRVILNRNGRVEFIRMDSIAGNPSPTAGRANPRGNTGRGAAPQPTAARTGGPADASATTGSAPNTGSSGSAVRTLGENRFAVDRSAIDRELSNPEALARQARIMPNYKDGESAGLRLVGVSPNSVYSQLGIRSGDVIHSVNGVALDNQRKALEMLEGMRREKRVVIEVERRGQKQKFEYDIQ